MSVAELALGLILSVARRITESDRRLRQELDATRIALAEARNTEEDLAGAVRQSRDDAERLVRVA